MKGYFE